MKELKLLLLSNLFFFSACSLIEADTEIDLKQWANNQGGYSFFKELTSSNCKIGVTSDAYEIKGVHNKKSVSIPLSEKMVTVLAVEEDEAFQDFLNEAKKIMESRDLAALFLIDDLGLTTQTVPVTIYFKKTPLSNHFDLYKHPVIPEGNSFLIGGNTLLISAAELNGHHLLLKASGHDFAAKNAAVYLDEHIIFYNLPIKDKSSAYWASAIYIYKEKFVVKLISTEQENLERFLIINPENRETVILSKDSEY